MKKLLLSLLWLLALSASAAVQTITAPVLIPMMPDSVATIPTLSAQTLNAADAKYFGVYRVMVGGSISNVYFRTSTITTGGTCDVRVETVSTTTGDPSGTLWSTDTNGSLVIDNADDTVDKTATLTSPAVVVAGDIVAVGIVVPSGFNGSFLRFDDWAKDMPYTDLHNGTSWTKDDGIPLIGVQYVDESWPWTGLAPFQSVATSTFSSSSTPDERGLYFSLPFPTRVVGVAVWIDSDADFDVKLYDSDGSTVMQTKSIDADAHATTTGDLQYIYFSDFEDLAANTNYRVTVLPTTTSSVGLPDFTVASAAMLNAFGGSGFHLTTRTDAGSWTQTTTTRPWISLLTTGFSDGTGGGGTVSHSYAQ